MKRVEDPNIGFDHRHTMPTAVKAPADGGVDLVRCESCMRMVTQFEIQRYGYCPACQGHRFRGMYPGKYTFEWLKILFWNLTRNWRIWGREGRGWTD